MPPITCNQKALEDIRLWNYFTRMRNTLIYLAQDVYGKVSAVLGRPPEQKNCLRLLTTSISRLGSFREALRRQQNLDPCLDRALAGCVAHCVLALYWPSIARP